MINYSCIELMKWNKKLLLKEIDFINEQYNSLGSKMLQITFGVASFTIGLLNLYPLKNSMDFFIFFVFIFIYFVIILPLFANYKEKKFKKYKDLIIVELIRRKDNAK